MKNLYVDERLSISHPVQLVSLVLYVLLGFHDVYCGDIGYNSLRKGAI